jgi:uncharacterized protein YaeQ
MEEKDKVSKIGFWMNLGFPEDNRSTTTSSSRVVLQLHKHPKKDAHSRLW